MIVPPQSNVTKTLMAGVIALSLSMTAGCATKRHVRSKIQPLEVRIDKLEDKAKSLETTVAEVETVASRVDERSKATEGRVTEVSAAATKANDKAVEADNKAGVARSLAQSGFEKAQEVEKKVEALHQGDLRVSAKESVFFAVNSTVLSRAARDQLDVLGASIAKLKHYAIEVQGFADQSGRAARNLELSQRRAEAVGRYLSARHNVPLHRMHVLGMGVAEGKSSAARRMGRRVEVKLLSNETESKSLSSLAGAR